MTHLFFRAVLVATTLFGGLTAHAQERVRHDFSLQQCIDYALDNHASVVQAKLDVAAAQQQVREFVSVGYPQVNGKLEFTHYFEIPAQVIPVTGFVNAITGPLGFPPVREEQYATLRFGLPNTATVGAQLTQLIADGTFFIGIQAVKAYVELSKKNAERTKTETATAVAKAYYGVLVARERAKLLETNRDQLQKLLENTRKLLENGFAQKLDVDRLEVAYNNLLTEIDKTQRLVDFALAALKFQMGMPQENDLRLTDVLRPDDFNPTAAQDTALAPDPENRQEVMALRQAIYVQNLNIKRLQIAYFPSLHGFMGTQTQALRQKFDLFDTRQRWFFSAYVGISLNVPIFDGFGRDARLQKAKIDQEKNYKTLENLALAVKFEHQNAKTALINNLKTLEIQKRNMTLAEEVYRVSAERYKQGQGTNIEVVQADAELKNARINYSNALLEAYSSRIDLYKALGTFDYNKVNW